MLLVVAIAIPVAGVLGGWNMGAASGLWSLFFGTFFVGLLYICLMACYGELCATVPFSGGAFGYCRCALGPFWGFVVGASEVLQYFSFVISATMSGSYALTFGFKTSPDFEPVYYLIIYIVTFLIQLRGGNLLWNSVIACSIITIFPVVLFLCGAFSKYDYNKYADLQPSMYTGFAGSEEFMTQSLFSPTYFYIGIEMLPQVCNHVRNPNVTLPRGLFYGCILSVLISLLAVIACAGIAPGYGEDFAAVGYPMDQILYEIYGIPARISDIIFVLSSNLLCVFSLMYSSGHQMGALAKSGLLPPFMGLTYGPHNVPYVALLVSTLLQFTVCCAIHFKYTEFRSYLVLLIAAMFVYLGVFASYIVFSTRFKNMQRHWYSPLGIAGAVVGIGIDVVLIASTFGYYLEDNFYIGIYFVFVAVCIIYYFVYAQYHQFFSPEEQQKFLKAYITNVNKRKKATKSAFSISTIVGDTMVVMFGRSNLFRGGSSHHSANSRDTNGAATIASKSESVSRTKRVTPAAAAVTVDSSGNTITDSFVASGETKSDRGNPSKITPLPARTPMPVIVETEPHEILMPVPVEPVAASVKSPSIKSPSAKATSVKMGSKKSQLRASWNVNNQSVFGMSNKAMTAQESQKFMEIVLGHGDESPEEMLATLANNFPDQFVMESHGTA